MTRLNHVLIRITNLEEAIADFKAMGFIVVYGQNLKRHIML